MQIYMVRHGETEYNLTGRVQGWANSPLTPLGIAQADAASKRVAGSGLVRIWASDSSRALDTANKIASVAKVPVYPTPLLRERCFGVLQGLTRAEIEVKYPEEVSAWRKDPLRSRPPEGESVMDVIDRCSEFLSELFAHSPDDNPIGVVCHGGSLRGIIVTLIGLPIEMWNAFHFANAGLSILETGKSPSIHLLNDTCHLDGVFANLPEADNSV
jgi:broad specificity phosphatase PhoE